MYDEPIEKRKIRISELDASSLIVMLKSLFATTWFLFQTTGVVNAFVAFMLARCSVRGTYLGRPADWLVAALSIGAGLIVLGFMWTVLIVVLAFGFAVVGAAWFDRE